MELGDTPKPPAGRAPAPPGFGGWGRLGDTSKPSRGEPLHPPGGGSRRRLDWGQETTRPAAGWAGGVYKGGSKQCAGMPSSTGPRGGRSCRETENKKIPAAAPNVGRRTICLPLFVLVV